MTEILQARLLAVALMLADGVDDAASSLHRYHLRAYGADNDGAPRVLNLVLNRGHFSRALLGNF